MKKDQSATFLIRAVNLYFWILLLFLPFILSGVETDEKSKNKSNKKSQYSFGVIPVLSFDSDLGVKYGAVINLFDFGETKVSPHYEQYLFLRLTNTTKGTLNLQALLESETLINKAKVIAEASYTIDQKLNFYGFNGTNAIYNSGFEEPESAEFKNSAFYSHHRNFMRLRFDVQKYLAGSKLRLLTGFTFNRYSVATPNQKENTSSNSINESGLYDKYTDWEIISPLEKSGGNISLISLGLIYDSRNDPCYCTNGKWIETVLIHSPSFLGDASFTKFIATYRQHTRILHDDITFSFRISAQQKLAGEIPFYFIPTFYDSRLSNDGVGGAYNLRGAMRNRIAADGFITGNFEIKARLHDFELLKQDFSVIISGFYDNAYITQTYNVELENVPANEQQIYFNPGKQKVHHAFGPGLYIVFNQNNIITVNYGIPTDNQLGKGGLYVGSSLLF